MHAWEYIIYYNIWLKRNFQDPTLKDSLQSAIELDIILFRCKTSDSYCMLITPNSRPRKGKQRERLAISSDFLRHGGTIKQTRAYEFKRYITETEHRELREASCFDSMLICTYICHMETAMVLLDDIRMIILE